MSERQIPFIAAFDRCQDMCLRRMVDPVSWLNPLSTLESGIRSCNKEFHRFTAEVIAARKADPLIAEKSDLVALFMEYQDEETGKGFPSEMIHDIIMSFILGMLPRSRHVLAFAYSVLWCLACTPPPPPPPPIKLGVTRRRAHSLL
jgi:hypothetical protein